MKKKTSLLVFIIAAVMVFSLWPQQVNAAENAARTTTADNVTINNWHDANALDDSTKNVGRIWTDKSVSAGDVTLTRPGKRVRHSNDQERCGFRFSGGIVCIIFDCQDHRADYSATGYRTGS